jgi:uncharacterized membrane protein
MENKSRSLAKMISWRAIGLIFWPIFSYKVTGSLFETGILTGGYIGMTVMYYYHERIWDRIKWGKND